MRPLHTLVLTFVALASLAGISAVAQHPATKPLIVEKIDENNLVALRGNTHPAATAANDRGRVSPGLAMSGMILVLRRSPEQQAAFDAFVASQYDSTSPNFHHWLQPEQVGENFGPALADIATVSSWLAGHGLSVDAVSKDRMTIRFSGTAAQVEDTFHTEIHNLVVNGEQHIANMGDPQVPMALDQVVLGPKALHNFVPRPLHRLGSQVALNKDTGKLERIPGTSAASTGPKPDFGFSTCSGSTCAIEDVAPYDFAAIYNVLPLWNNSIDGAGQTIAIAGRSDVRASDVASFRSAFGLPTAKFNVVNNGADPGFCQGTTGNCTLDDQIENGLDVEWSGAVAKGATVDLVVTQQTSTNDAIFDSAQYVVTNKNASIINVSYGLCELELGTGGNSSYNTLWQSAASEGISVLVATGDAGSPACDQGASQNGPYGAAFGLAVSGLASSQYDTAVGGTDLNWGSTVSTYWNASNNTTTGATAKGYIPEVPWNDACTAPVVVSYVNQQFTVNLSANQVCDEIATSQLTFGTNETFFLGLVNTVGGGGGASNCTTNGTTSTTVTPNPATCTAGYPKPSWQATVTGITNDNARDVPDVSFFAGNGLLGSAYLICISDAGTCVSSPTQTGEAIGEEIGGTSVASPAMAGVMALINQKAGSAQGNPNAALYALAAKQTYSSCSTESVTAGSSSCYFNDVDTGTISMPCAAGSPNCTVSGTNTYGVLTGFDAGVGYDQATGLGSLNVANVVNGYTASVTTTGTATATVAVSATPSTFTSAQGTSVTVTVTGGSGTPTGTVSLTSGSFNSATKSLASGSVTFSLSPGLLAVGTDTITANYSGDTVYASAKGTTQVTVTQVTYTLSATTPAAVAPGGSATSTITVASTNGYVGTVTLACALTTSPAGAANLPVCAMTGSPVNLSATATSGTATANVTTTAATTAAMKKPVGGWTEAGGGAVLALLAFFGIPARRRGWRAMMGMLVLLFTLGSLAACGGGGSKSSGNPGTTAGQYTFTVTGTGNPAVTPAPTTTFTVTVN